MSDMEAERRRPWKLLFAAQICSLGRSVFSIAEQYMLTRIGQSINPDMLIWG